MAEQTLHPAVNLRATASGKPHTLRGRKKCLDLNQTQLLCSKRADHPASACPLRLLQAHLALESTRSQDHLALDKSLTGQIGRVEVDWMHLPEVQTMSIEDPLHNKYSLVRGAARRARQLQSGALPK